jgi:hypothetical protein
MCYRTNKETATIEVEVTVPDKQTCDGKYNKSVCSIAGGLPKFFYL